MSESKSVNDASSSTKGTIFQLYVALLKCFEMTSGQSIIIEKYGDVTISDDTQIETKRYSDDLTDGHSNFWKTLKNWMANGYYDSKYASLLLLTTQDFGENSSLKDWNTLPLDRRHQLLIDINAKAEERFAKRNPKPGEKSVPIPEVLSWQRFILDPSKKPKLLIMLPKIDITTNAPDFGEIFSLISERYCKSILTEKQDDFLTTLLGYIQDPHFLSGTAWEIPYGDFSDKVKEITPIYCHGTRMFPSKFFIANNATLPTDTKTYGDKLFVQKIKDIEYDDVVSAAIRDHIAAENTILSEYSSYHVSPSKHQDFKQEVLSSFEPKYRIAKRKMTSLIPDSQSFYDAVTGENSPVFTGFDNTPIWFRNGLIHIEMNDPMSSLKWKLE